MKVTFSHCPQRNHGFPRTNLKISRNGKKGEVEIHFLPLKIHTDRLYRTGLTGGKSACSRGNLDAKGRMAIPGAAS